MKDKMDEKIIAIYFKDLSKERQKEILKQWHTTEKKENWGSFPVAYAVRSIS